MIVASGKKGKVVEYDEDEHFGFIDYKHEGKRVYLPYEQAKGKGLEDDIEVTFDIEMVGSEPHAINVTLE